MKSANVFRTALVAVVLQSVIASPALAFYWYDFLLPETPSAPPLPYLAKNGMDHYSGPACVQMALNACPNPLSRGYHSQDDIYASIMAHNAEPTAWFSNPIGMRGALEDPMFSGCGYWLDKSSTDKHAVLGKVLSWMRLYEYLTPVSIGKNEHWVVIFGCRTDLPSDIWPFGQVVLVHSLLFYDPLAADGPSAFNMVGTGVWLNDAAYWGGPHKKPGSGWHNKYLAVIDPPGQIQLAAEPLLREGPILPAEEISERFRVWVDEMRGTDIAEHYPEAFGDMGAVRPADVDAGDYVYYIVSSDDQRTAVIFNAYDASFEEMRYSPQPHQMIADQGLAREALSEALLILGVEVLDISTPTLHYDPELAPIRRFTPVWKAQVVAQDDRGGFETEVIMDYSGAVLSGLEVIQDPNEQPR